MWRLDRAEEPSGSEMVGGISTSKPKIALQTVLLSFLGVNLCDAICFV